MLLIGARKRALTCTNAVHAHRVITRRFARVPVQRWGTSRGAGVQHRVFARDYLSPAHRDHPDAGCPSAALLDEVGRCTGTTKRAYIAGAKAILDGICTRLVPEDPESALRTALLPFTMLVVSMQLARALSDKKRSNAVLEEGVHSAGRRSVRARC